MARVEGASVVIEKLKAPFWFGLPGYAWLVGGVALVGGAAYFLFFRGSGSSTATSTPQSTATPALDNSGVLSPYGSGGTTPPPSPAFDPNGSIIPPGPTGPPTPVHNGATPAAQALSEHEKEWLKLHPNSTMAEVNANNAAWVKAQK